MGAHVHGSPQGRKGVPLIHGDQLEFNSQSDHLLNPFGHLKGPLLGQVEIQARAELP